MAKRTITTNATLGEVIDAVYAEVMAEFGDPELARLSAQALAMECLTEFDTDPVPAAAELAPMAI